VLVVGRSGTGKTTCAVLRLFAIEVLFKYRFASFQQQNQGALSKTRYTAEDLDQNVGLQCIFVTASPVLTNEIKRYYQRLTAQMREELLKKQQRQAAKGQEQK